jgi:hypothetical protein
VQRLTPQIFCSTNFSGTTVLRTCYPKSLRSITSASRDGIGSIGDSVLAIFNGNAVYSSGGNDTEKPGQA